MKTLNDNFSFLIAQIGVFFANCDGKYDDREKKFIQEFVKRLDDIVSEETKKLIEQVGQKDKITFDELVLSANSLVKDLPENAREVCINLFNEFIYKLINVDNVCHPNEIKYYDEWKSLVK